MLFYFPNNFFQEVCFTPNNDFIILKQLLHQIQILKKDCHDLNYEVKEKFKTFLYDVDDLTNDVPTAINQLQIQINQKKKLQFNEITQLEKENFEISKQLSNLNEHYNELKLEFCNREEKLNYIQHEYEILNRKYEDLRHHAENTYTKMEESQVLHKALAEIARLVISDYVSNTHKSLDANLDSFVKNNRYVLLEY